MIVLGLGSNVETGGNTREKNLIQAIKLLNEYSGIKTEKISSLYQTQPVGFTEQPDFLNVVVSVTTKLSPHQLLAACLEIENQMGRIRRIRWGPRNIDIDLLIYDNISIISENLNLPHPRLPERRFVLVPLFEIAGDIPLYNGMSCQGLLDLSPDSTLVEKYHSEVFEQFRACLKTVPTPTDGTF